MRIFKHIYPFQRGLKPFLNQPPDSPYLLDCKGLDLQGNALHPAIPLANVPNISLNFPFPQFLVNNYYLLSLNETTIDLVNDDWSLTPLANTLGGSYWTFADFGKYAILSNGVACYEFFDGTVSQLSDDMPACCSYCRFRGRIVGGGLLSTWHDCDAGFVVWSDIGSKSFALGVKNEAGYMSPEVGDIVRVTSDDDYVYCYGSDGVAILVPAGRGFGLRKVSTMGIGFEGSACRNLFVGSDGTLYAIEKGLVRELGYKHLFEEKDVAISYDSIESAFYLRTSSETYKLKDGQLTRLGSPISDVFSLGGLIMACNQVDDSFELWTDWLSFGVSGLKTLMSVELIGSGFEGLKVGAKAMYKDGSVHEVPPFPIENTFTTLKLSGELISVGLQGVAGDNFQLAELQMNVQFVDKRVTRGFIYDGQAYDRPNS